MNINVNFQSVEAAEDGKRNPGPARYRHAGSTAGTLTNPVFFVYNSNLFREFQMIINNSKCFNKIDVRQETFNIITLY